MEEGKKQDLYCKLFIDASRLERDELTELVSSITGERGSRTIETNILSVDIRLNKEYPSSKFAGSKPTDPADEFLHYRYFLDIFPITDPVNRGKYIAAIGRLLEGLWTQNYRAVAACRFDEELPKEGGMGYNPAEKA